MLLRLAAAEPLNQLGGLAMTQDTGEKVAVWTGIGSIEFRRSNTAVPTVIYKDKLPVYSWKYWISYQCIAGNIGKLGPNSQCKLLADINLTVQYGIAFIQS